MKKLAPIWFEVQDVLFPFLEKEIEEPLTEKLQQLITTLELVRIEDMLMWQPTFRLYMLKHFSYWKSNRGLFICIQCEHQHSITAGTIMEGTIKPLISINKEVSYDEHPTIWIGKLILLERSA